MKFKMTGGMVYWLALLCLALAGCHDNGPLQEIVVITDPKLQPFLAALDRVDRRALGFSCISSNVPITMQIEGRGKEPLWRLYFEGNPSRNICFRKSGDGYRWVSEQEIHQGPGWIQTGEGVVRESLEMEFHTESEYGIITNQLILLYKGGDPTLEVNPLTLAVVQPALERWAGAPVEPKPLDTSDDFSPGLLFMSLIGLVLMGITLIGVAVFFVALGVTIGVGVLSTSVLVGFLRRSITDGFRTLFLLLGALVGMGGGVLAIALANWISKVPWTSPWRWLLGVSLGLVLGLGGAWIFNKVWSRLAMLIADKVRKRGA